ncbi:ATP-dependent RNA helicase DbpA [Psychrobium sp. 1_MG-2023]|uniref:ATP-dependent RNA helicase DbpA n=1 Tax=Psychrobium sp. 1_MG-2023 TaxID=3062624 RepID=UPI0026966766|nr:ATP-dependent RNA helicase DbpA [Psychrobium sp. 1_MG-2023]MDP2562720.1 ATP-dependent RNA helicase DbpA [Psychrobium sp. 1_MG-2023]
MQSNDFSQLSLHPSLLDNLKTLDYKEMTPIQAQSLPPILEGKDVIAQGKTGSGKTAAFALGLLNNLDVKKFRVQSLVLCPTRELADQVAKEIRKLARAIHNIKVLTLCGGTPMGPQIGSLEHGAHIIVGTPGRIEDHLSRGRLKLNHLNTLVLDEADRMLEMGFQSALDLIFSLCPAQRQNLLFSATFPEGVKPIAKRLMTDPVSVEVASTHSNDSIDQVFYKVDDNRHRSHAVRLVLQQAKSESTVIFCTTKRDVQDLASDLKDYGFNVLALHGDLEQRDRDQTLVRFANKSVSVLVATDVAARGLDVDNLDAVINYHISSDPEVHVHRIGRTGRAGGKGKAYSLFAEKEFNKIGRLEEFLNITVEPSPLPDNSVLDQPIQKPKMATLQIDGGKKQKVRAGDILGALTSKGGIAGSDVGKIQLSDNWAYVAVASNVANIALKKISEGKLKGRSFRVRKFK